LIFRWLPDLYYVNIDIFQLSIDINNLSVFIFFNENLAEKYAIFGEEFGKQ